MTRCLFIPSAIGQGRYCFLFFEKFAEGCLVGEVQCVGYLADGNFVVLEQSHGMMNDFLADKKVRCLAGGFLDDACQVFLGNAERLGIEV